MLVVENCPSVVFGSFPHSPFIFVRKSCSARSSDEYYYYTVFLVDCFLAQLTKVDYGLWIMADDDDDVCAVMMT